MLLTLSVVGSMFAVKMQCRLTYGSALQSLRKLISPCQSTMHHAGLDHVDSCCRSTSMKLESVSVRVLTSDLHHQLRHHEAVMARAVGADISRGEKSLVILRLVVMLTGAAP